MAKPKFDLEKVGDSLVAKWATTRTDGNQRWLTLYDFVHHCMRLAYKAGQASQRYTARRKAANDFYNLADKVQKKGPWNIGRFLGEVWEKWEEQENAKN